MQKPTYHRSFPMFSKPLFHIFEWFTGKKKKKQRKKCNKEVKKRACTKMNSKRVVILINGHWTYRTINNGKHTRREPYKLISLPLLYIIRRSTFCFQCTIRRKRGCDSSSENFITTSHTHNLTFMANHNMVRISFSVFLYFSLSSFPHFYTFSISRNLKTIVIRTSETHFTIKIT